MWKEYTKIDTANARDLEGSKRLVEGTFRDPAVEYLKNLKWEATEKLDGTNISIYWDGHRVSIHGRTESAQLPADLLQMLEACFMDSDTEQMFEQMFPPKEELGGAVKYLTDVTIYGEGIGPKIQKAGKLYGPQYRFLVFDIKVGETYLEHSNPFYKEIVKAFGMEEVPSLPDMTVEEAIEFVKGKPKSLLSDDAPMEGVVLRTKVRLYGPNGGRLIVKVKAKDYEAYNPYAEKYRWIKKGKCVVLNDFGTKRRCTIQKIVSDTEKIENENTVMTLREVDTGEQFFCIHAEYVEPYNKENWNGGGRP